MKIENECVTNDDDFATAQGKHGKLCDTFFTGNFPPITARFCEIFTLPSSPWCILIRKILSCGYPNNKLYKNLIGSIVTIPYPVIRLPLNEM